MNSWNWKELSLYLYERVCIVNDHCQSNHGNYCWERKNSPGWGRIFVGSNNVRKSKRLDHKLHISSWFLQVENNFKSPTICSRLTYLFTFACLSRCCLASNPSSFTSSPSPSSSPRIPTSPSSLLLTLFFPSALMAVLTHEAMSLASLRLLLAIFFLKVWISVSNAVALLLS